MLKNKKFRMLLCLLTALMVLFAFSGCGDNDDENDADTSSSDSESETVESGTRSGSGDDLSLGLETGDTSVSRDDYTLLGDYFYTESYRVETEDGSAVTELGFDMYLTYDEDSGYSSADGVLAVYYDDDGNFTGYEAYIGINPIRYTISYQVATNSTYFTALALDSSGAITGVLWDNTVTDTETGVTTYYTGSETYYDSGATERTYEEQYIVGDDGILTISQTTTKEYDEDGNTTTDETVTY